jgi:hypothetical protein
MAQKPCGKKSRAIKPIGKPWRISLALRRYTLWGRKAGRVSMSNPPVLVISSSSFAKFLSSAAGRSANDFGANSSYVLVADVKMA